MVRGSHRTGHSVRLTRQTSDVGHSSTSNIQHAGYSLGHSGISNVYGEPQFHAQGRFLRLLHPLSGTRANMRAREKKATAIALLQGRRGGSRWGGRSLTIPGRTPFVSFHLFLFLTLVSAPVGDCHPVHQPIVIDPRRFSEDL